MYCRVSILSIDTSTNLLLLLIRPDSFRLTKNFWHQSIAICVRNIKHPDLNSILIQTSLKAYQSSWCFKAFSIQPLLINAKVNAVERPFPVTSMHGPQYIYLIYSIRVHFKLTVFAPIFVEIGSQARVAE